MITLLTMFAGAVWLMSGLLAFGFGHKAFTAQAAFEQFCTLDWPVAFLFLVFWPLVLVYVWCKKMKERT